MSAASIARLKAGWQHEYAEWKQRSLADLELVYMWVDGIYVKAGLEKDKAESGGRESTESWSAVLRELKQRGLRCPRVIVGDGHLGIWGALANVYPAATEQRCWNHRILNVIDRVPKKRQAEAREFLRGMMYADTREMAAARKEQFQAWCRKQGCAPAGELLDHDWERLVAYYDFPLQHWKHLRTTNPVESPFAAVRLRTTAAKRYKKVENATAVLWKTLLLAEQKFRRLSAPELLAEVTAGVRYENGERLRAVTVGCQKVAA